jgi:hypothetical protein
MKILTSVLLSLISLSAFALRTNLTAADLEKLRKGQELEKVEELKNEVFPRVTLINIIPHTPKENMKTFTQFENHKKFIPGVTKSKIVKVNGNQTDVFFEMKMPIVKNTKYTTRHTIVYEGNNAILTWDLVKSEQLKNTKGMMMFEEFEGKTLFTYVTHVTPDSSMAWTVKGRVVPDVKATMKEVRSYLAKTAGSTK